MVWQICLLIRDESTNFSIAYRNLNIFLDSIRSSLWSFEWHWWQCIELSFQFLLNNLLLIWWHYVNALESMWCHTNVIHAISEGEKEDKKKRTVSPTIVDDWRRLSAFLFIICISNAKFQCDGWRCSDRHQSSSENEGKYGAHSVKQFIFKCQVMFWYRLINDPKKCSIFFHLNAFCLSHTCIIIKCLYDVLCIFNRVISRLVTLIADHLSNMLVWQSSSSSWDPIKYHPYFNWFFFLSSALCFISLLVFQVIEANDGLEYIEFCECTIISKMIFKFQRPLKSQKTFERYRYISLYDCYLICYIDLHTIHWWDLLYFLGFGCYWSTVVFPNKILLFKIVDIVQIHEWESPNNFCFSFGIFAFVMDFVNWTICIYYLSWNWIMHIMNGDFILILI